MQSRSHRATSVQCPSRIAPGCVIPTPSPGEMAMFQNTNRSSLPFLRAARLRQNSKEHKELMTTIRDLHRQYLLPFKYLEEQAPDRVDDLIAKAQLTLPWLDKYEQAWPARIYLKRYVDARRPHLMCTRHVRLKQVRMQESQTSYKPPTRNLEDDPDDIPEDHGPAVREFLGSLAPSLEHHLDAFVELGIKDQKTLQAFLSWPQVVQAQFLDEGHGVLQLTSLEKKGLFVGCSLLTQRALQEFLVHIVKPGYP